MLEELNNYALQDLVLSALRLAGSPIDLAKRLGTSKRTVLKWICTNKATEKSRRKMNEFIIFSLSGTLREEHSYIKEGNSSQGCQSDR
jgi:hypothetical protein